MSDPLIFVVHGIPVAKGRPRFALRGRYPVAYTPKKTRDAEKHFLDECCSEKPIVPLEGPLKVKVIFFMNKPNSLKSNIIWHTKRPDIDNLLKLVLDCLNGVFYNDDSQIVDIVASKFYSEVPRTEVKIEKV